MVSMSIGVDDERQRAGRSKKLRLRQSRSPSVSFWVARVMGRIAQKFRAAGPYLLLGGTRQAKAGSYPKSLYPAACPRVRSIKKQQTPPRYKYACVWQKRLAPI